MNALGEFRGGACRWAFSYAEADRARPCAGRRRGAPRGEATGIRARKFLVAQSAGLVNGVTMLTSDLLVEHAKACPAGNLKVRPVMRHHHVDAVCRRNAAAFGPADRCAARISGTGPLRSNDIHRRRCRSG